MTQALGKDEDPEVNQESSIDMYFSADVETDGPIPGPFSLLSFAFVCAGTFDGHRFQRSTPSRDHSFYCELRPISNRYEFEALQVNKLDRHRLLIEGIDPVIAMSDAAEWILRTAGKCRPVLVAYPLSFDWSWLYWYFVSFSEFGSPFSHSRCFDLKTAFATKAHLPISAAGRSKLFPHLRGHRVHTHHALDDALEQAEIFANIFEWEGTR